jgi:ADP-ribosyl-[dinitrogen reductase] hydrolase
VPADHFAWKAGRDQVESFIPPPLFEIVRDFCRACGCYLGELVSGLDPLVVSAAILDSDPGVTPIGHEWVSDAVPWYEFSDGRLCFPRGFPPIDVWMNASGLAAHKIAPPVRVRRRSGVRPTPGSCLCGTVRFEVGSLTSVESCHCVDCRKSQGGEFSTNGTADGFRLLEGEPALRAYASSADKQRFFCSRCGVTLFAREAGTGIRVRLASLDADPGVDVEAHIWTSQQVPWQQLPEDAPTFDRHRLRSGSGSQP